MPGQGVGGNPVVDSGNDAGAQHHPTSAIGNQCSHCNRHNVSENADEPLQLASRSGQRSKDGAWVIENTLSCMNGIASTVQHSSTQVAGSGQHSAQISSIISATQALPTTLNAAIEAARADEQGCGFAVVADEVPLLAQIRVSLRKRSRS